MYNVYEPICILSMCLFKWEEYRIYQKISLDTKSGIYSNAPGNVASIVIMLERVKKHCAVTSLNSMDTLFKALANHR